MNKKVSVKKPASLAGLDKKLIEVENQAHEYLAGWKRAKADYENLQKRTEQQRAKIVKIANAEVIKGLLPVVDNLERALKTKTSDIELKSGVELVLKQLREVLASNGVVEIKAQGQKFNPEEHEAIANVPGQKEICIIEHARGYKMHDLILRPSRVSVGTGAK